MTNENLPHLAHLSETCKVTQFLERNEEDFYRDHLTNHRLLLSDVKELKEKTAKTSTEVLQNFDNAHNKLVEKYEALIIKMRSIIDEQKKVKAEVDTFLRRNNSSPEMMELEEKLDESK